MAGSRLAVRRVGVVDTLLVTVDERTREIGLRMALGTTRRSILAQFFFEGIILTLFSGLIGMGFAAALMALMGNVQGQGGFDPPSPRRHGRRELASPTGREERTR